MTSTTKATSRAARKAGRTPGSASRRARRPSLNNEEFLSKAFELFVESGLERTSIDAITASAGMAKRTVYLRYGDKKSLFLAALQRAIEAWIVPIDRLRAAEVEDLEETLVAIGQILVDNVLSPAGLRLLRLTNAESVHIPEIGVYTVHLGQDRTLEYLTELFARRLGGPTEFSEAADAAEAFLHLVVGGPANATAWGLKRDKAAVDRRIRFSVRLILDGVVPAGQRRRPDQGPGPAAGQPQQLKAVLAETIDQLGAMLEQLKLAQAEAPRDDVGDKLAQAEAPRDDVADAPSLPSRRVARSRFGSTR